MLSAKPREIEIGARNDAEGQALYRRFLDVRRDSALSWGFLGKTWHPFRRTYALIGRRSLKTCRGFLSPVEAISRLAGVTDEDLS